MLWVLTLRKLATESPRNISVVTNTCALIFRNNFKNWKKNILEIGAKYNYISCMENFSQLSLKEQKKNFENGAIWLAENFWFFLFFLLKFFWDLKNVKQPVDGVGLFCTIFDFWNYKISRPKVDKGPKKLGISYFQKCWKLTKIYYTEKLFILMARYNFWAFFGSEIIEIIVLGANGRYDVGWQPDGATGSPQPTSPAKSVQF